jgi:hypothetical protein
MVVRTSAILRIHESIAGERKVLDVQLWIFKIGIQHFRNSQEDLDFFSLDCLSLLV